MTKDASNDTMIRRGIRHLGQHTGGRFVENFCAIGGGMVGMGYVVLVEILPSACYAIGRCLNAPASDHPFPWGVVIVVGMMVMPKTVGKLTTGKLWEALAGRMGGRS